MKLSRREFTALAVSMALASKAVHAAAPNTPSLARALNGKLLFGAAITPGQVTVSAPDFIKHHFSVVVAENAMKPQELTANGKGEGQYDFSNADAMVDFAVANGIKMRGHTLVWHQQTPSWMFTEDGKTVSRETLIARLEKYIADVVGHFKGRVFAWDVVNEAFSFGESGTRTDDQGMRMSPYREIIGPDYIEIAFRAAARADPEALLFYNDYESQHPRKIEAVSKLVADLKARGVKVDGIGHQAHCSMGHPDVDTLEWAIGQYAKLGVTQHITELDIALNERLTDSEVFEASPALLKRQAKRYAEFFRMFLRQRKHVSAVLVWGISDAQSWLRQWPRPRFEAPLLFDEDFQPKPAFKALLAVAREPLK
ncbi:MAG: endo-1,4-beta-xylanase [Rhizobacter sp.]